jgi:multiple sugar transport system permease protein
VAGKRPHERTVGPGLASRLDRHATLLLLAPSMLVIGVAVVYPLGYSLWVSVVDYDVSPVHSWVGIRNYQRVVEFTSFPQALARTAWLSAAAVLLEVALGLLLALAVASGGRWRRRLVPLLVLPLFASAVAAGLFWRLLLDGDGPVSFVAEQLLQRPFDEDWLSNPWLTWSGIVLADAWQWTPIVFLVVYAGLRTIPPELHEAAGLDGATATRSFTFVTLPLVAPFVALALLLRLADAMKMFDVPAIFGGTREETETVALYLYGEGFTYFHLGLAAAGSWLFVGAVAVAAAPLVVLIVRQRAQWV